MTNPWTTYFHRDGCGKAAFFYRASQLRDGRGLRPEFARNVNGTDVFEDDEFVCGSCLKALLTPPRWEYFREGML